MAVLDPRLMSPHRRNYRGREMPRVTDKEGSVEYVLEDGRNLLCLIQNPP